MCVRVCGGACSYQHGLLCLSFHGAQRRFLVSCLLPPLLLLLRDLLCSLLPLAPAGEEKVCILINHINKSLGDVRNQLKSSSQHWFTH